MEQSHCLAKSLPACTKTKQEQEKEEHRRMYQQFEDLVSSLPTVKGCTLRELCCYDGCYLYAETVVGVMAVQKLFQARDTDIIVATLPKSGTTWMKALLFAIVNRNCTDKYCHALATLSPHECVPFLEMQLYGNNRVPDLDSLSSPRLLSTHIPFHLLPNSIVESGCRIVYLCRNPKDVFVSYWHFISKIKESNGIIEPSSIEVDFDHFCKGHSSFGPFGDHMSGYWNASLQVGKYNILFMRFEELINDTVTEVKRLAEFVGCRFTVDEDKDGIVEDIVDSCKFNNLSNLEVNSCGKMKMMNATVENRLYFRQGVVGDWMKHLTSDMARRLDEIANIKFEGSGLTI